MVLAFYLPRARYLPGRAKVLFFYFQTVPGLPDIKILTFFETRRLSWQFWSFYNDTATKISVTQNFCPDTKNLENLSQYDNYKKKTGRTSRTNGHIILPIAPLLFQNEAADQ